MPKQSKPYPTKRKTHHSKFILDDGREFALAVRYPTGAQLKNAQSGADGDFIAIGISCILTAQIDGAGPFTGQDIMDNEDADVCADILARVFGGLLDPNSNSA